jgi:NAD-specific glutamate dehydrogenase
MTSISVRQYVVGTYRELDLKEAEITKVQTGGPDGGTSPIDKYPERADLLY